ncbi:MAG: Gfo/Idh/MocA family protein [Dehalococcoidia bacterium]
MAENSIRIGVVGAGANTRKLHIPGFQKIEGVEVVSVANRTRESSERTAAEFKIPQAFDAWHDLVASSDSNAIMIGTWPYLHGPVTLAALAAGKHVLTEARMALNAVEARQMLAASRGQPELIAMVVPSPFTFAVDATIQDLISDGYLGDILSIDLQGGASGFLNSDAPLTWRQDADLSGDNILFMGIWYEALMRWVGPATRVMARAKVAAPLRRDEASGRLRAVRVPDHVEILADMACGAVARLQFSSITGLAPSPGAWLYGSQGTLHYDHSAVKLYGGKRGESVLQEIAVKPEKRGGWRVEEEFIGAIRGSEPVRFTTFQDGVRYMDFSSGVTQSVLTGEAVSLPVS